VSYSPHQALYFAHWLSLEGHYEQALTQTIASAKVDLNPHQVEAALFALRSPLSKGVILADEVGLGKTIEASLVLAQKWAEQKRRLLLIVPATLRKQWSLELLEKFELPSLILESKNFNETKKAGTDNPFDLKLWREPAIVITSYEFAARKKEDIARIPWDLAVFDEAHKLRNSYKPDGAKTAKAINAALHNRPKILMTATPLQNSLLELYGLVSLIDPYFFGDLASFKLRYARPNVETVELIQLRKRLSSIVHRTLRREVQETGSFNFTKRFSITEDFRPTDQELDLYERVSDYLRSDDLLAIKPKARHLVTLVIRKILASSTYALQGTLETMIERLEAQEPLLEGLEDDYEDARDLMDEEFVDEDDSKAIIDISDLKEEVELLQGFKSLAEQISINAKADALLRVLLRAFEMTERLGGARKAVIFTESVRTQTWLAKLLSQEGFAGQIVLLNGSNQDTGSQKIYREWQQRYKDTVRVSGSKSADMKAALVDKFKEDATLLISTEAGAEGVNLQFCSLLINYDLPWNPQRVEQRIGRIHRYGQKHDVVVVNFINKGNRADERVFELLSEKFKLFEGVFGASDEILGSIESGVDIEKRINEIYQKCRTDEEIEREFNALQAQLHQELSHRIQETSRSVLDYFDKDVVKKLNLRQESTVQSLNDYQQMMLYLAKARLPNAIFQHSHFEYQHQRYDVSWVDAEANNAQFFRPQEGLGKHLIEQAKQQTLASDVELVLDYDALETHCADVRLLIGKTGELQVDKYILSSKNQSQKQEYLVLAACTEEGELISVETAQRLLTVPSAEQSSNLPLQHTETLNNALNQQRSRHFADVEQQNEIYYEEEVQKLEAWSDDRKVALDLQIKQLDKEIAEARRSARQLPSLKEKMEAKRVLKQLERERDQTVLNYHEEKKKIEGKEDELLETVAQALEMTSRNETLFKVRWRVEGILV
jgi:ERCC4-related helicase